MIAESPTVKHNQLQMDGLGLNMLERELVTRFVQLHGHCTLQRKPDNTIEVRMADPELLETDGDKELTSRHLYVNVTKYVREDHKCAAYCAKTGKVWNVDSLLRMLPVEQRAVTPSRIKRRIDHLDQAATLERDGSGRMVPIGPGEVIPLNEIDDPAHPALHYLRERGFEADPLVRQFRAGYCEGINPSLRAARMPGDLCSPPQGRIVFFADMDGKQLGWQARRLELWIEQNLFYWNHSKGEWANIGHRDGEGGFVVNDRYNGTHIGRDQDCVLDRKYLNAPGMQTGRVLLGLDAAVKWRFETGIRTIGLVEGVFDAARLGPPFVAMMGLTLKPGQAELLRGQGFDRVVYLCDRDGNPDNAERTRGSTGNLRGIIEDVQELTLPEGRKDAAEMTPEESEILRLKAGL